MRTRILVAAVVALTFGVASSFAQGQQPRKKDLPPRKGQVPQTSPTPSNPTIQSQGGRLGAENVPVASHMTAVMQVDSMMQQMEDLQRRAESYSQSFGELAELHHGADRTEILMMQRMSDSMRAMAGEIKMSLLQYKDMLEDETTDESLDTKADVQSFRDIFDAFTSNIQGAVDHLQTLQERLGQG